MKLPGGTVWNGGPGAHWSFSHWDLEGREACTESLSVQGKGREGRGKRGGEGRKRMEGKGTGMQGKRPGEGGKEGRRGGQGKGGKRIEGKAGSGPQAL